MKKILISAFLVLMGTSIAQAGIIAQYNVSNFNGGTAAHGLYTFGNPSPTTWTIDALFTISEDNSNVKTATLIGTLMNGTNNGSINLSLSNWADTGPYKQEQGAADPNPNADFFFGMTGTIVLNGTSYTNIQACSACDNNAGYGFQYGLGANAKNANELGASSWIQHSGLSGTSHWDLNLAFSAVPEPTTLLLMGLGIFGLGFKGRKRL